MFSRPLALQRHVSRQRGIGLPAAIFMIVLMAVIAIAVNQLVSRNTQSFQEEVNLTRAFYAAESGANIAMNTIFPPEEYPAYVTTQECAAGPRVYSFIADGLNQCTASVTCSSVVVRGTNYATIASTGSCGELVRTIQVRTSY